MRRDARSGRRSGRYREVADRELTAAAAAGSTSAYLELWSRHRAAGAAFAGAFAPIADPDALMREAHARVLSALRSRQGPRDAFRPYLLTTIRDVAGTRGIRATSRRDGTAEPAEACEGRAAAEDGTVATLAQSTTMRAFRALSERRQAVLWYTAVESLPREEVAKLLGLTEDAVAPVSCRARDALRTAWVRAHIADDSVPRECRRTVTGLAAHRRGRMPARKAASIREHLGECSVCLTIAAGLDDVGSRLGRLALIAVLGLAGAAAYEGWLQAQRRPAAGCGRPAVTADVGAPAGTASR